MNNDKKALFKQVNDPSNVLGAEVQEQYRYWEESELWEAGGIVPDDIDPNYKHVFASGVTWGLLNADSLVELDEKKVPKQILVDRKALIHLLQALNGPGHLVRELQATRDLPKLLSEDNPNPINQLIDDYNVWVNKHNEKVNAAKGTPKG